MSGLLELDYIGLAEFSSMARNSDKISSSSSSSSVNVNEDDQSGSNFNLKETELRLGLPGSESPERKLAAPGVSPSGFPPPPPPCSLRNLVSGAKRGFSDAINGSSREWVLPLSTGSVVDLGRATTKEAAPGSQSSKPSLEKKPSVTANATVPAAKAQVVGWPPVRSFRKNSLTSNLSKKSDDGKDKLGLDCSYVKVSMEGAPYLRKVNLKTYNNYMQLSLALEKMFSCFTIGRCSSGNEGHIVDSIKGSECVLTYEDKDGDWMLVGDVPWEMFVNSCQKLRIIKGSEGIGPEKLGAKKNREDEQRRCYQGIEMNSEGFFGEGGLQYVC